MNNIVSWFYETMVNESIKNLKKHDFEALFAVDRLAACEEILKRVPSDKTIGVGGSVTIREIGIIDKLKKQGNIIYDHWQDGLSKEESLRIRKTQQSSNIYLTSANAITITGEIINIDGFCNRISTMAFGPDEVIFVAGKNKLVRDVKEGIERVKNIAAPMNAKRFGADTPCATLGRCVDCNSPQRICRGTLILERRPFATKMLVIIVMEDLGF